MLGKEKYSNGQRSYVFEDDVLTYYYKNGKVKAFGRYEDEQMEGEWRYFRESGELWEVGNFRGGRKNGIWLRYGKDQKVEHKALFVEDKEQKNRGR